MPDSETVKGAPEGFAPMEARPRFLLAFDAGCGPCRTFKELISFFDRRYRMDYLSLEDADETGVIGRLPARRRYSSAHLVSPGGSVFSGADAIPTILGLLPGGWLLSRVAGDSKVGRAGVRFVYGAASRLHDAGNCRPRSES
jgi:predicted DCC family thiol-disulfide oxidoreductase YuxK